MKIEYRNGDLFETEIKTIVHGCNAQGVMRSGVAKIVYEKFPKAYERYRKEYELNNQLALGSIIVVPCDDKIIVNAITQEFYGRRDDTRYVSYDAVVEVMKKINTFSEIYGITEVAMPQIGAGLANGEWDIISAIIETELKHVKPVVYVL